MKRTAQVAIIVIVCSVHTMQAKVWHVHPDSTANRIQACLDSCAEGDTVLAGPGIYVENILWPETENIKLWSKTGPESTLIDGGKCGSVISFRSFPSLLCDSTTVIEGFTLRNGSSLIGGGINCRVWHSPTIRRNIICDNTACSGGAIYYDGGVDDRFGGPTIIDNTICNNSAFHEGGAICTVWGGYTMLRGNTIKENGAQYGGGIYEYGHCHTHIANNMIVDNTAEIGGSLYIGWRCSPEIDSCTISGNCIEGVHFEQLDGGTPIIHFNNICGNCSYGVTNIDKYNSVNATRNWWGDASGPYHSQDNPSGRGDTVSNYVDFGLWLREPVPMNPGIEEHTTSSPLTLKLQVDPNPFTSTTKIRYTIYDARNTEQELRNSNFEMRKPIMNIYDASGRLVKSFDHESCIMDHESTISWDGTDQSNRQLPNGIYFVTLQADEYSETKKVLLVR